MGRWLIPLSRGYKTHDFSTFSGEYGKSIVGHIERFIAQCGKMKLKWIQKL